MVALLAETQTAKETARQLAEEQAQQLTDEASAIKTENEELRAAAAQMRGARDEAESKLATLAPEIEHLKASAFEAQVRKRSLWPTFKNVLSHFDIRTIVLPRQARDKHRESTQKRSVCLQKQAVEEEAALRLQLVEAQDQVAQAQKGHATEIKAMEAEMVRANTTVFPPLFGAYEKGSFLP